jgi:hypothetical protein
VGEVRTNPAPNDPSAELAWLAFQYVSEELSADDAAAFELRLAEDQAAREAVAQAVELSAALKLAIGDQVESTEPAEVFLVEARGYWSQKAWLQPAAWMAVGAAACLAAVFCFYQPRADENRPPVAAGEGVDGDLSPASSLAMVWAQSRHSGSDADDLATMANGSDEQGADDQSAGDHDVSDDSQMIAPGWLLAAVTRGEMTDDLHLTSDDE